MSYPNLYPVLDFELRHHHPNPDIDDMLHGDRTRTDENGEEVIDAGTPEPPVVIAPEPDPDPPNPNPGPAPAPEPTDEPLTLRAGDSGERLVGGDNNDELHGGAGPDVLIGGPGNDGLNGRAGDDVLMGGPGSDELWSGSGHYDLLIGGHDDDLLESHGPGAVMIGGPGRDVFDLRYLLTGAVDNNSARIIDFQDGVDTIKICGVGGEGATRFLDFYNRVSEAGLTFDMRWIASEQGRDVVVELGDDTITLVDTRLSEFQLDVLDSQTVWLQAGDLVIV